MDLSGKKLGPYEIKKKLGQGGMGAVYLAHQSTMDRDVAIKILPVVLAQDSSYQERFRREAKLIARLEHARILPVHDYGEEGGISYIVMRYLKAGTLAERIRAGKIPMAEIVRIMQQVAQGLDYAHAKGVIHRDIKPANIMLDHNGDVYITDFGLSKLVEDSAQLTGSAIMGTPEYMAPEQGMDGVVDQRSDIYALGVVLYEMLTGQVPFTGKSGMVIIVKHINETFPDPSETNPEIPHAVADVVLKATAKEPSERYQSCTEMAHALSAAAAGTVKARPRGSMNWRLLAVIGGLILVAIVAAGYALLSGSRVGAPAPTLTTQPVVAASQPAAAPTPTSAPAAPTNIVQPPPPPEALSPEDMKPNLAVQSGLMECAGPMRPVIAYDISASPLDGQYVFAGTASGVRVTNDKFIIDPMDINAPGKPLRVGPPLNNTDVLLKVAWNEGAGGFRLLVSSDPQGRVSYSARIDPGSGRVLLRKQEKVLEDKPITTNLYDGQTHTVRLSAIDGNLTFYVDGTVVASAQGTPPLPAGIVLLYVGDQAMELDMIAVCGN